MFVVIAMMFSGIAFGFLMRRHRFTHIGKVTIFFIWILLFVLGVDVVPLGVEVVPLGVDVVPPGVVVPFLASPDGVV